MSNNSGNWNSMNYFCYPAHVEVSYEWDENERFLGPGQRIWFKKISLFLIQLNLFPLNRVKSAVIIQLKLMDLF